MVKAEGTRESILEVLVRMHALCSVEFKVNQVRDYTAEQDAQNITNTKSEPQTSIPTAYLPTYLGISILHWGPPEQPSSCL